MHSVPHVASVPQFIEHVPLLQTSGDTQAMPQPPQLFGSFSAATHVVPPSHWMSPVGHRHFPPWHCNPVPHLVPHVPQLALSFKESTHVVPQASSPAGHTQEPATQSNPAWHLTPHPPQLFVSV
jgi:hypothetical protein